LPSYKDEDIEYMSGDERITCIMLKYEDEHTVLKSKDERIMPRSEDERRVPKSEDERK